MKYKVTVRFGNFVPGEIVDIPEEHDLPESLFEEGYFEPLEMPKRKEKKPLKTSKESSPKISISAPSNITFTTSTGTNSTKPDKLD